MGCKTWHTRDFIQRHQPAKKIINLIKASIFYYSLPPLNLTAPRTIEYCPPCIPRRSRVLSYPYPVVPASNSVGCCVSWSIGGRLNRDEFCFIYFLPPTSMAEKMRQRPPPSSSPCAPSHLTISHRFGRFLVGCCVSPSTVSHRNSWRRRPLYFNFFCRSIRRPKRRVNVLPHTFRPFASLLQRPPHRRRHCSVGCCVDPSNSSHPSPMLRPSHNF